MTFFFRLSIIAWFIAFILPAQVFAQDASDCPMEGYTVLTVNGMLTDKDGALRNLDALTKRIPPRFNGQSISFDYLYNPTHFGGVADYFDVAYQKLWEGSNLADVDLDRMHQDLSEKVKTQKVLFVAHSQGNFYANALYARITKSSGDVSAESLGVYGVATPASFVAGGGKWITSDTDAVIVGKVRDILGRQIMQPNAHFELDPKVDGNGHSFSGVYLKYASERIIDDISRSLERLTSSPTEFNGQGCIPSPDLGLGYTLASGIQFGTDKIAQSFTSTANQSVHLGSIAASGVESFFVFTESSLRFAAEGVSSSLSFIDNTTRRVGLSIGQNFFVWTHDASEMRLAKEPEGITSATNLTQMQYAAVVSSSRPPASLLQNIPTLSAPVVSEAQRLAALRAQLDAASLALAVLARTLPTAAVASPSGTALSGTPEVAGASTTQPTQPVTPDPIKLVASVMESEGAPGGLQLPPVSMPRESTSTIPLEPTPEIVADTVAPLPPVIVSPQGSVFSEPQITFAGTGEASTSLLVSWNAGPVSVVRVFDVVRSSETEGHWSGTLDLPEGTTVLAFALRDAAGNLSSTTVRTVDVIPPTPLPAIRAPLPGDLLFSEVSTLPGREYIELYNQSDAAIYLSGTNLLMPDVLHSIPLVGIVAPHGHWLISRTDASGVVADLVSDGPAWENLGQVDLRLTDHETIIDELPYCSDWCGRMGSGMVIERFSPTLSTADYEGNWRAPIDFLSDTPGAGYGTPRKPNTLRFLLTLGGTIGADLAPAPATYFITRDLTVVSGATLALSSGSTLEFTSAGRLVVAGTLVANGTQDDPVLMHGYIDPTLGIDGRVDLSVSGEMSLAHTDLSIVRGLVLDHASTSLSDVSLVSGEYGISGYGGTFTANDLEIRILSGSALTLSDATTTLASTTIESTGLVGAHGIVQVAGGSLEAEDLSIGFCGSTVTSAIELYGASSTIDGLSIKGCGAVGLYAASNAVVTVHDAAISIPLGAGAVATGGANLAFSSTTFSGSSFDVVAENGTVTIVQ